jgi:hypothetical protein
LHLVNAFDEVLQEAFDYREEGPVAKWAVRSTFLPIVWNWDKISAGPCGSRSDEISYCEGLQ